MSDYKLSKGDYISLGKAVAQFNKTINELKTEENKSYLPEEFNYKELKEQIVGKAELDRYIKNLRSFKKENAEVYLTEGEEKITIWEKNVLNQERRIATRRIEKALQNVNKYDKSTIDTLKYNLENMKQLETSTKEDFKDIVARIHKLGRKDYDLKRAIQYRENYYKAIQESGLENYKNYTKFKNRIDRIKNPIKFFEFIKKSDYFTDLFVKYEPRKRYYIKCK